ncbi:MAG: type II toxin-antitoxin system RelE/ParE family toxin, partial [Proteobacteria bacterium]|nr:type II toxin-antitoxin system RelE/ParE family toxin [Pseudomonadota bacterium]
QGVTEMRISFGPGYRVYYCRNDNIVFVLLCGGTKSGQQRDIVKAQEMAKLLKEN